MRPIDGKDLADTLLGEIFDRGQDSARYEDMLEIGAMTYREKEWMDGFDEGLNHVYRMIENAPTIDAVPVVRCKDCKYRIKEGEPFYELVKGLCTLNGNFVPDDFYCAEGKKQTYREIQDK